MLKLQYAALVACLSLFASVAAGQPVAAITGPAVSAPGELVVLTSQNSVGDNHLWILPEDKAQATPGCDTVDSKVFFATAVPGTYQFILVVSDKEARMSYAIHHVTILKGNGSNPPTNPPADPPTDPPTGPPVVDPVDPPTDPPVNPPTNPPGFGRYENLFTTSKINSEQLNDPTTRKDLFDTLDKVVSQMRVQCDSGACPTLQQARMTIGKAIEDVLLRRQGSSRDVPWSAGWRVPNNQWLEQENPTTTQEYIKAMMALTAGLKQ